MTIITNNPAIDAVSTGVPSLERRADTFILWSSIVAYYQILDVPQPRTFADERRAFVSMLPVLSSRYNGQWVAISDGQIVEHDADRKAVTRKFFRDRTRGPVYIGFVGQPPTIRQATPFRARPRA